MTDKKLKIEFAPGCFDQFEGTQEELDELVAQITEMVESGEMVEVGREMTEEDFDELPDDVKAQLLRNFSDSDLDNIDQRKLQ